jgi:hypothetical protein
MHAYVNAVATAKLNVDLSQHLDCFLGRGFEIRKAKSDSLSLRFPAGTSVGDMRDAFAAGLTALLLKLPDSGAGWGLARPVRVRPTGRGARLRPAAALPLAA